MDLRDLFPLIAFCFCFFFVFAKCVDPENNVKHDNVNEKEPMKNLSVCDVCACIDNFVNCTNRNLETNLEKAQWPKKPLHEVTFVHNSIVHIRPFPAVAINKLILRSNNIVKIEDRAFKKIVNLTDLDLSHNSLTSEKLRTNVFEGPFTAEADTPLPNLKVLNLSYNVLHSLDALLFKHLSSIRILILEGNPLTQLDLHTQLAITSIPYLEELDLSHCDLKTLPDHPFHPIKKYLKKLDLSNNGFTSIPSAIEDAEVLEHLYLDENPIRRISASNVFPDMPRLKELSLCCMPHLKVIGPGAFSGLRGLESLTIRNSPHLREIDEDALVAKFNPLLKIAEDRVYPPLKKLDLSDNALRYLPSRLVDRWESLEELDLMNNEWSCDCDNQYLIGTLLPEWGEKLMHEDVHELKCSGPPEHAGKNLTSLAKRHLRCLDTYGAQPEKDAAVLLGISIGLLLAIPIGLLIFTLWRRGFFFCGSQSPASFSRAFYKRASNNEDI